MTKRPWGKLGATGKFPRGKIHASDEGEIAVAISASKGNVILHFGTEVVWLGMPPEQAREMAQSLVKYAEQAEKQR